MSDSQLWEFWRPEAGFAGGVVTTFVVLLLAMGLLFLVRERRRLFRSEYWFITYLLGVIGGVGLIILSGIIPGLCAWPEGLVLLFLSLLAYVAEDVERNK